MHLNNNLPEPMRSIVILHEIGHHMLHKDIAKSFKEFNIFDPTGNIMEYEANLFAAQVMHPDNDTVELIKWIRHHLLRCHFGISSILPLSTESKSLQEIFFDCALLHGS